MATKEWLGMSRVVLVLTLVFSLVFLAFSVTSAVTYSKVNLAQERIVLENPERIVEVLPNGTLFLGFKIQMINPTGYAVHVTSLNWYSEVVNVTAAIPLVSNYTAENVGLVFAKDTTINLAFGWYVTGGPLERLLGFFNYSALHDLNYSLQTAPYAHSFEFVGYLDDFKHDYDRENYLNGLVTINLTYEYGMEAT